MTGGHAEIEDENMLFIYGNSYDVVLTNPAFQDTVEKISFEFLFIEFIIETSIMNTLKKFKYICNYLGSSKYLTSRRPTSCLCSKSPSSKAYPPSKLSIYSLRETPFTAAPFSRSSSSTGSRQSYK